MIVLLLGCTRSCDLLYRNWVNVALDLTVERLTAFLTGVSVHGAGSCATVTLGLDHSDPWRPCSYVSEGGLWHSLWSTVCLELGSDSSESYTARRVWAKWNIRWLTLVNTDLLMQSVLSLKERIWQEEQKLQTHVIGPTKVLTTKHLTFCW